jgi:hypothetical protein
MSPDTKPALSAPPDPKRIRSRARNGNSGRPLFPKSHLPVFCLLFAFGESHARVLHVVVATEYESIRTATPISSGREPKRGGGPETEEQ